MLGGAARCTLSANGTGLRCCCRMAKHHGGGLGARTRPDFGARGPTCRVLPTTRYASRSPPDQALRAVTPCTLFMMWPANRTRLARKGVLVAALIAPLLAGDCISELYLQQPVPIVSSSPYDCVTTTLANTPGVSDTGHFHHDHGRDHLLFTAQDPETGHRFQGEVTGIGGSYSPAFTMIFTFGGLPGPSKRSLNEALGVGRHLMSALRASCAPAATDLIRCSYHEKQIPTCELSS